MFGEKLKEARLRAGYTQQQLGEIIGKDKIIVCKFETNYCLPSAEDLKKITDLLQISPQELQFPQVATSKTRVATRTKPKTRPDTYRMTVPLKKSEFPKLNKDNLKKCGYNNLREFIQMAYQQLEKQLNNNK